MFRILKRRFFPKQFDPDAGMSRLNILKAFNLYKPHSGGDYQSRAKLTIQAINETLPSLHRISSLTNGRDTKAKAITSFPVDKSEIDAALRLGTIFDNHGSDKGAAERNYHYIYGPLLSRIGSPRLIVEIGLGTNFTDVVSNMGPGGRPGASLRAFREFCPEAEVYGGDIDSRILFQESRIFTSRVDQTDFVSMDRFSSSLPAPCDLFIDDGLHSPHSNLNSLSCGLNVVRPGGWVIIEDIGAPAVILWKIVIHILPENFRPQLYFQGNSFVMGGGETRID